MKQLRFRTRLIAVLSLFAIVPALLLTFLWSATLTKALPFVSGHGAWEQTAQSGQAAIAELRNSHLTPRQKALLDVHQRELQSSLEQSRRYSFLASRAIRVVLLGGFVVLALVIFVVSRVAGHLSRQMSRPLDELVQWTELVERGERLPEPGELSPGDDKALPSANPARGAPEFETLRQRMRRMAKALELGRQRALEAERIRTMRESARVFAHELKNPLTPIRFAIDRLRRHSPAELRESVEVIETESHRLERLARNFAEFGKLPEGAPSEIDVAELARYATSATVPDTMDLKLEIENDLPRIHGHHDALAGALSNLLLNAVDACEGRGEIGVRVGSTGNNGGRCVRISVRDNGPGIRPEDIERIWDPYVTRKAGGTGLGLAITKQAVLAHNGTIETRSTLGKGTEITITLPSNGV
jgi:signal transduction histidine kinase